MDEKKMPATDDWDSLPLDPAADDWDAPPPKPAPARDDDLDAPPPEPAPPKPASPPAEDDDFDAPPPEPGPEPGPLSKPAPSPGPLDAFFAEENAAGAPPPPLPEARAPEPGRKPAAAREEEEGEDDFQSGEDVSAEIDQAFSQLAPKPSPAAVQKVELDIDGIVFPEPAPEAEEPPPEQPPPPAAEPSPEPPAAPALAPPSRRRVPAAKLLILIAPALLLLGTLGYVARRVLTPAPPPPALSIDPAVPQRDPLPGEMPLKPFYINFAGDPETIVEMSVTLYYNDAQHRELIEARLPAVREVIFRLARAKGGQVVTSGEIQRDLRRELAQAANEALGDEALSYVQLTQFRILH